jgi:hypothetical protein
MADGECPSDNGQSDSVASMMAASSRREIC